MKIGILVTGRVAEALVPDHGEYDVQFQKFLTGLGYDFEAWFVLDGDFPESVDDADGWLITGSKHGVYEEHDWLPPLEDFIRKIRDSGKPLVGVCFGHQVIAQALGGKVVKYDGGWAVGRQIYDFGGQEIALNAWHQDQVVELPEGAEVLAGNDFCEYAALSYGENIFTVQPHPEFVASYLDGLLTHRARGVVPDEMIEKATGDLSKPVDNAAMAEKIAEVFAKAGKQ